MAGAQELLTAFIGLEMSSIASYILASYKRDAPRSNEAAMKYFLLGSFATAFFLYGIALTYGATGTTRLDMMGQAGAQTSATLLKMGLGLVFVGLAFKVAAAPFQLWTPDVYEGAPAPVTAMLSTGPKAAAFALALRILADVEAASALWLWALWAVAVISMFAGNLGALVQTNLKRMLAYSSIAHAGYILVALTAAAASDRPEAGIAAALFYLVSYALVKLGAFLIVAQLGGAGERHIEIEDFTGLARRQPAMAACLSLFLLSLLGLPVTAGFVGKFYVFNAALEANLIWLAIILAVNSVIGAYYYLRVMVAMYMREATQDVAAEPVPWTLSIVLWIAAAGTVFVGLSPTRVIDYAAKAALSVR
jgi:NADH-quinone oxidoreductase subunit N